MNQSSACVLWCQPDLDYTIVHIFKIRARAARLTKPKAYGGSGGAGRRYGSRYALAASAPARPPPPPSPAGAGGGAAARGPLRPSFSISFGMSFLSTPLSPLCVCVCLYNIMAHTVTTHRDQTQG
jgi:hypothetical protein